MILTSQSRDVINPHALRAQTGSVLALALLSSLGVGAGCGGRSAGFLSCCQRAFADLSHPLQLGPEGGAYLEPHFLKVGHL